jgi:ferrous iron transport protein B
MGIGMISSFVAREVFVSAVGTVYSVGDAQSDAGQTDLQSRMKADTDPVSGLPVFTPLIAIVLMVYYVLAMQCMSTLAVVRRETNSWRWPVFMFSYMTVIAYVGALVTYQGGKMLGFE